MQEIKRLRGFRFGFCFGNTAVGRTEAGTVALWNFEGIESCCWESVMFDQLRDDGMMR